MDAHLEGNLANEASMLVLDTLELIVQVILPFSPCWDSNLLAVNELVLVEGLCLSIQAIAWF